MSDLIIPTDKIDLPTFLRGFLNDRSSYAQEVGEVLADELSKEENKYLYFSKKTSLIDFTVQYSTCEGDGIEMRKHDVRHILESADISILSDLVDFFQPQHHTKVKEWVDSIQDPEKKKKMIKEVM